MKKTWLIKYSYNFSKIIFIPLLEIKLIPAIIFGLDVLSGIILNFLIIIDNIIIISFMAK